MTAKKQEVYKSHFDVARRNGELDDFHKSDLLNRECLRAIDKAVAASKYDANHSDYKSAAKNIVDEYGYQRVEWVLASVVTSSLFDERYSPKNHNWAVRFDSPANRGYECNAHPTKLDNFIDAVRDIPVQREKQLQFVGAWEKRKRMLGSKRLTWLHSNSGTYVVKDFVTHDQIEARYNQALIDTIATRVRYVAALVETTDPDKKDGPNVFSNAIKRLNKLRDELLGEHPMLSALVTHVAESRDMAELKERIGTLLHEVSELTGEKPSVLGQLADGKAASAATEKNTPATPSKNKPEL